VGKVYFDFCSSVSQPVGHDPLAGLVGGMECLENNNSVTLKLCCIPGTYRMFSCNTKVTGLTDNRTALALEFPKRCSLSTFQENPLPESSRSRGSS
jgi:hypothetical protein